MSTRSENKGLYCPSMEHDSCGIGFIANLKGFKTHELIDDALEMLENMEHRGGTGFDKDTGDGAGILTQIPHEFFVQECKAQGLRLPQFGAYAVGMIFFPQDAEVREECRKILNEAIEDSGLELLGYRKVPVNPEGIGKMALDASPEIEQLFIRLKHNLYAPDVLERKVFVLRKYTTNMVREKIPHTEDDFYLSSMSYKTIVYKGQFTTKQLRSYYPDLSDKKFKSAIALIHSRFSTNTFPKWKLAQPFDYIAHNGEINTIKGNVNWMQAKEALMHSSLFSKEDMEMMLPICDENRSDSSNLDSMIELLVFGGRSLPHAMMMLIPEAWQEDNHMPAYKKGFYQYHSCFMEPWDGPASICFTDGKIVGATLDRNGLRPSRYVITKDDRIIMASEAGALPVDPANVVKKGRVQPGRMVIADIGQGRIISDDELKKEICLQQPYSKWVQDQLIPVGDLPLSEEESLKVPEDLKERQISLGYTAEDLRTIIQPMVEGGKDPIGSMGSDIPLAVLSKQSRHFSHYFKQLFAQVSNPPIDPIRERLVMSLFVHLGALGNILLEYPEHAKQIQLSSPVLTDLQFNKLRNLKEHDTFKVVELNAYYPGFYKKGALKKSLIAMCKTAEKALKNGAGLLIINNHEPNEDRVAIPSLLAVSHLHHYLLRRKLRAKTSIIVQAGDAWETHHYATLLGFGATAVFPVVAYQTICNLYAKGHLDQEIPLTSHLESYIKAIQGGLLKIMSKMGISTMQSYASAQIFEIIGLNKDLVQESFTNTVSRIGGLGYDEVAKEQLLRHEVAFPKITSHKLLPVGGIYQWKRQGEYHLFNPETIHLLQQATWKNNFETYQQYAEKVNNQVEQAVTLRGLFDFKKAKAIPIEEVEPAKNIYKRFATGAMSFGSISHEAHSTLAIAMNRLGGKSNSGEGGEDEIRFEKKANGDWERSAIKQVASGRFGVTSNYLTNADELQIKMAQGAKPGEGGQLPGHKVDEWIARVRHSTPGVGLISPPPHHDIYSIEDLAQLIFDLKNANRAARINVKLVSEAGVGTIAAGVAKAKADVILISGHDGGTGASPLSSIQHAGLPWELGVAEAHQTLIKNRLRGRVTLQADGQIRTGKDLAVAAMLGAEEWGISTAALIVEGCIMMRKCHLNTCPVGVATQNKELRKLYQGKPEYVENYFRFLAEDLRHIMADLGIRTVDELVGRSDLLKVRKDREHWKLKNLNLEAVLYRTSAEYGVRQFKNEPQKHQLDHVLDWNLVNAAEEYFENKVPVKAEHNIYSINRAVGALLSNEISKRYGSEGLPDRALQFHFKGSAGQSFGAFTTKGVLFKLEGEANDYFGKGLSGATISVFPDQKATFKAEEQIIVGNVALYGATSGKVFIRGLAGERFAVRNSGAEAVVEGVGDHACEYMTGGLVVILGGAGRNFGAGMSGGIAYVFDPKKNVSDRCREDGLLFEDLLHEDRLRLNQKIKEHYELTGSATAQQMLIYWKETINSFTKVISKEYKAALQKQQESGEAVIRKIS